ncbi:MAG: FAD-dependent oxidoreductase, partial [Desulfobacterales bacterium]|nr:FAD-dependent oxidoreductase [Desulfobacterales bacterium]
GQSPPDSCVAGGADLAEAIAAVMGMTIEAKEPDIALPGCTYGPSEAAIKYNYQGLSNCQAAALLYGGMKVCRIGCLGLGSCMQACPFDAITMSDRGLPVVDEEKCTGCGTCERVCPKHIIKLSSVTRRILREYTTDDCTTPCQRMCPAGINISAYIEHVSGGDYSGAVQIIKERNPFPTVIGRICPRPCEDACRRNLIDEPVAINYLKRYAADVEMEQQQHSQPYCAPGTGRPIAVIGGGVEGLSAAFFSARLGHSPTVFEASANLGGLLRTAIAGYRLPRTVLDWDIQGVAELGVSFKTGMTMGKDFTLASLLKQDYEAVLLASGGWDSRLERGTAARAEEPVPGVFLLIELLRSGLDNKYQIPVTADVVMAGGAPLAEKAVHICKHLGAENITLIFNESREKTDLSDEQIQNLEKAGAKIVFNAAITRVTGLENRLESIEYTDTRSGQSFVTTAQTLVIDAGRLPEMIFRKPPRPEQEEAAPAPDPNAPIQWEGIQPYKNPIYSEEKGLLSKNDPITDYSAAIRAIAGGRRAAASVHKIMYNMELALSEDVVSGNSMLQTVMHIDNAKKSARHIMPACNPSEVPGKYPEVELGYSKTDARAEADRCLRCGIICYKD